MYTNTITRCINFIKQVHKFKSNHQSKTSLFHIILLNLNALLNDLMIELNDQQQLQYLTDLLAKSFLCIRQLYFKSKRAYENPVISRAQTIKARQFVENIWQLVLAVFHTFIHTHVFCMPRVKISIISMQNVYNASHSSTCRCDFAT